MTREDPWKAQERRNRLLAKAAHETGGYMALGHKLAQAAQEKKEAELRAAGRRQLLLPLREGWPIEQARIGALHDLATRILAGAGAKAPVGLHVMGHADRTGALLVEMSGDLDGLADLRPDPPSAPDRLRRDDARFLDRTLHKEIVRLESKRREGAADLEEIAPWSGTRPPVPERRSSSAFRPETFARAFWTGMQVHGMLVVALLALWLVGAVSWEDGNGVARLAMPIDFTIVPLVLRFLLPGVRRRRAVRTRRPSAGRNGTAGALLIALALVLNGVCLVASPAGAGWDELRLVGMGSCTVLILAGLALVTGSNRPKPEPIAVDGPSPPVAVAAQSLPPAVDTATRLLDAAGPSAERMRTALRECDRITALAADHPQAADAAEHLRTHLASLVDLHDRAAALGDDADRPMLVERLVRGVEALASAAAVARRALARSASDELETELRYLSTRADDAAFPLSPIT